MSIQNLRNKYKEHPCFKPLIDYCAEKNISFEIMKEAVVKDTYTIKKTYYMKVDDIIITSYVDMYSWNDLILMMAKAYTYLGLEIPKSLDALLYFFNDKKYFNS